MLESRDLAMMAKPDWRYLSHITVDDEVVGRFVDGISGMIVSGST